MSPAISSPDQATLRRFLLGDLPAPEADGVRQFLEQHPADAATLAGLVADDTFVSQLREVAGVAGPASVELSELMTRLERLPRTEETAERTSSSAGSLSSPRSGSASAFNPNEETVAPGIDSFLGQESTGNSATQLPTKADENATDFLSPPAAAGELGQLGGYRILRIMGSGGMGMVFEASDGQLNRRVALKVMRPTLAIDSTAKERFLREARAAAAIEDDHIIPIFHVGEANGVPFLTMPMLKGESLDARMKRIGAMPAADVIRIGREVALGLAAAHERGLIHRDIKPGNIWLEAQPARVGGGERAKILDFGLARSEEDKGELHLTMSGAIVGTPTYMAPEQARADKVDARTDLFSLGVMLYRMTTGELPFKGNNAISQLYALAADSATHPSLINRELPTDLADLIMRLIEKDPGNRPQSAQQVAEALTALAGTHGRNVMGSTTSSTFPVPVASNSDSTASFTRHVAEVPAPRPAKKRSRTLAGIAVAMALLAGGAYLAYQIVIIRDKDGNKIAEFKMPKDGTLEVRPDNNTKESPATQGKYALSFEKKDKVSVPSLKLDASRPLTLEGYFTQLADAPSSSFLFTFGGIYLMGGKSWYLGVWEDKQYTSKAGAIPVRLGKRTHVAGVFTGKRFLLFVDGQLSVSRDYDSPRQIQSSFSMGNEGNHPCTGLIEEVRVSSSARYDKNFTPVQRFEPDADTLALYHFDEGAGEVLKDSSGNNHHGQINGAKWVKADGTQLTPTAQPSQYALRFDSDGKVWSSVPIRTLVPDFSRPCTMEGYVTARDKTGAGYPFICDGGAAIGGGVDSMWGARSHADDPNGKHTSIDVPGTIRVAIGKRTHLALVSTGRQLRIYVDGWLAGQKDFGDLSVDKRKPHFTLGRAFTGEILEVRVSKVARYDKDFKPQPRFEPDADTLALYHFDEGEGDVLKDSSGNLHHGKITGAKWVKADGSPIVSPPASQYALQFENQKGPVFADVGSLVLDLLGPRTIEGYITPDGAEWGSPLHVWARNVGEPGVVEIRSVRGKWSFSFAANDKNGKIVGVEVPGAIPVVPGKKTHVALVFTGRQFRLFVDGALVLTKDASDFAFHESIKASFCMGWGFKGLINEVRISKMARYDKEFTPAKRFEPDADTLALYHFDEGQGKILKDSSGNAHHGSIDKAKWMKADGTPIPVNDAWLNEVAAMPAKEKVEAVAAKLKELNPGFVDEVKHKLDGDVTELEFLTDNVTDISPVRALIGLKYLKCTGSSFGKGRLLDLSPLMGMKLTKLDCAANPLTDLTPLRQVPLWWLSIHYTPVTDLSPLKDVPLTSLNCGATKIADLSAVRDMPLLQSLICSNNRLLTDLSPLKNTKLTYVGCTLTSITDLSPLRGIPLKRINCDFKPERDAEILRSIMTLENINEKPAADFWKDVDAQLAAFNAWLKAVAAMPSAQQLEAVKLKLKESNVGFDGEFVNVSSMAGKITGVKFASDNVADLTPLRALTGLEVLNCPGSSAGKGKLADLSPVKDLPLKELWCHFTRVSDLSPLKGMKLTNVRIGETQVSDLTALKDMPLTYLACNGTKVSDLSVLKNMPLTYLNCVNTLVTDLSPLRGLPLKELKCDFKPEYAPLLRSIKTLEKINDKPVAEVLK